MTQLGPQPSWLESRSVCGYNPQPERSPVGDCGKLPTLHLEWREWGAWCNMPGSVWNPSPTPDEADSWCSLDDFADASSRARKATVNA